MTLEIEQRARELNMLDSSGHWIKSEELFLHRGWIILTLDWPNSGRMHFLAKDMAAVRKYVDYFIMATT